MEAVYILFTTVALSFQFTEAEISALSVINLLAEKIESTDSQLSLLRDELHATKLELKETRADLEYMKETCSGADGVTKQWNPSDGRIAMPPNVETLMQIRSSIMRGFRAEKTKLRTITKKVSEAITYVEANVTSFKNDVDTIIDDKFVAMKAELSKVNGRFQIQLVDVRNGLKQSKENIEKLETSVKKNRKASNSMKRKVPTLTSDIANLSEKHKKLDQSLIGHMSTYQHEIDKAVQNRERCQQGYLNAVGLSGNGFPITRHVQFETSFQKTPVISIGTWALDVGNKENTRYFASVSHPSPTGFSLIMSTWENTVIYGLGMQWMACPN